MAGTDREVVKIAMDEVDFRPLAEVFQRPGLSNHGSVMAILSRDPDTGASTSVLRLPAGWRTRGPEFHSALQEQFLVEGDITFAGQRFEAPAYFCWPPNTVHGPAKSEGGALLLMVMDGPFDIQWTEIIDWDEYEG